MASSIVAASHRWPDRNIHTESQCFLDSPNSTGPGKKTDLCHNSNIFVKRNSNAKAFSKHSMVKSHGQDFLSEYLFGQREQKGEVLPVSSANLPGYRVQPVQTPLGLAPLRQPSQAKLKIKGFADNTGLVQGLEDCGQ